MVTDPATHGAAMHSAATHGAAMHSAAAGAPTHGAATHSTGAAASAAAGAPTHSTGAAAGPAASAGALLAPEEVADRIDAVTKAVGVAVVGHDDAVRMALAALLAGGHVLIEDNPGLGKTLLARSLAGALGLEFRRLQFTPDLLPADITGSYLFHPGGGEFDFRPGPVFCGLLLADEINRTPPKTQSALLEAMAERQVSVEGVTHPLPAPFHVIATANQIEYEGTYPLPEAQLDRFLVRLRLGYPSGDAEHEMLRRRIARAAGDPAVAAVTDPAGLLLWQQSVEQVRVDDDVLGYCVDLARASRAHSAVEAGISPRGTQSLVLLARSWAVAAGRAFVLPEDVKSVAVAAWAHRLVLKLAAYADTVTGEDVVRELLASVPSPPADRLAREASGDTP